MGFPFCQVFHQPDDVRPSGEVLLRPGEPTGPQHALELTASDEWAAVRLPVDQQAKPRQMATLSPWQPHAVAD